MEQSQAGVTQESIKSEVQSQVYEDTVVQRMRTGVLSMDIQVIELILRIFQLFGSGLGRVGEGSILGSCGL